MGSPLNFRITSPGCTPADSAGPSASTLLTSAFGARQADGVGHVLPTSPICTPIRPRVTLPVARNWSTTRMASSMGMASEMPMKPPREMICELMPTASPCRFSSGPPELPGLTATSVWMKGRYSPVSRPMALTMPEVTVESRPNGEPMASTHRPFFSVLGRRWSAASWSWHRS